MDPDRWEKVARVFGTARAMRGEQRSLLKQHDASQPFMDDPALGPDFDAARAEAQTADAPEPPAATREIGRYQVNRTIGSGGMGAVYEAVQDHPRRLVALKVLRHGAASRQAMKRFRHEAEILGRLRHPNIAQIYEAGTFDTGEGAQPFFAMELVKGRPLLEYAESRELGARQRLELLVKVCEAVQHAHLKGVIHRDLKPDNILVDDSGEPKILDFGVARVTDSDVQVTTMRTDIGQLIGTVPYMSPEQVAGDPGELDARSDVYALGVVVYELLTGCLPYDLRDKAIPEAVRIIGEQDPTPLSSVSRVFRGDIDTIVAKALEKEKARRYQSAAELATDIRHHLSDEPIVARPASAFYQLRKFARRNKTLVGGLAAVFVVLIAGIIVSTVGFMQASNQRAAAVEEARKALVINEFLSDMLMSANPDEGRRELTVVELIGEVAPRIDEEFASHPEVAARLHLTIGSAYWRLGQLGEAEVHLRAAYERGRAIDGLEVPTLDALARLADVYAKQDRYEKAVKPWREALDGRRRFLGDSHPKTLQAMVCLADALGRIAGVGDRPDAEELLRSAVASSRATHGDDAPITFEVVRHLATFLTANGSFVEAEEHARLLLEWCRRNPGNDFSTTRAQIELAVPIGWLGHYEEAADLALPACEMRARLHGPHSKWAFSCYRTAGLVLQWLGRPAEAEEYFRQHRATWDKLPYRRDDEPWQPDFFLARLEMLEGRLDPAEACPVIETFVRRKEPGTSRNIGVTAHVLCLVRQGDFQQAERALREYDETIMREVPDDHFERQLHFRALAELYEGLDRQEKAAAYRALLREAEESRASD
ncbi:MAG: serine/threonine protein kinase [Planctomycetota bacterium]